MPLRSDLTWTDGSAFTAEDVAFTVNTVLSFQLGFDWHSYYDPEWLDHAEAVDAHTVKFYFKRQPNCSGMAVRRLAGTGGSKEVLVAEDCGCSRPCCPRRAVRRKIEVLKNRVAELQTQVDALIADGLTATGEEAHRLAGNASPQAG